MENIPELKSPIRSSALVAANYNKLSDHIRRLTPEGIQCSVFCGGASCKYENPDNWATDCLAIQGIYSHWITDNILAMARPSTAIITKKNIIQQFESLGIKSVINLQSPKEHSSCGQPLENSGFSYDPNIFMENKIYYYNFAWKDYGDATTMGLLNMVKVLAFALTEGRVAVHCHAGLGRTGVLIACFLIYALRVEANDAIRYVRYKRPGSVQTRGQILCVRHFARFVLPQQCTFYIRECEKEKYMAQFSLHRFVRRQKVILHGYEERMYKYFPKIVHILCERILKLSGCWKNEYPENSNMPITKEFLCSQSGSGILRHESIYSISSNISDSSRIDLDQQYSPTGDEMNTLSVTSAPPSPSPSECSDSFSELYDAEINEELLLENKCFQELETQRCFSCEDDGVKVYDISVVISALLIDISSMDSEMKAHARKLQMDINSSQVGWARINVENNIVVLAAILFDWIESLKEPVLTMDNMENIVIYYKQPEHCLSKFDIKSGYLIEYLLHFLSKIQPISKEVQMDIIRRFLAALAHQCVVINNVVIPSSKGFCKLREGTLACAMEFLESLFMVLDVHHQDVVRDEFMESQNQLFDCKSEAEPNCFQ